MYRGTYLGHNIAAKKILSRASTNRAAVAEMDYEVAALSHLSHPCVIAIYGICEDTDGSVYLITEFCDCGSLDAYYSTPAFNNSEFLRVSFELMSGLAYLHHRNTPHGSIRLTNVGLWALVS